MNSILLWGVLAVVFIATIYTVSRLSKRKPHMDVSFGATFLQRHPAVVFTIAITVPILVGVVLVNTAFGSKARIVRKVHRPHRVNSARPETPVVEPSPVLKMVVSDGSIDTDIGVLNTCDSKEVTVIKEGRVLCQEAQSPDVKAWMMDARRQEKEILIKYVTRIKEVQQLLRDPHSAPSAMQPPVMQQNALLWWWQQVTNKPAVTEEAKEPPFKDKYAEVFFFLALVLGVLSKYFWDFYESKRGGAHTDFEPHVIVMSFIVAALVYYSIQQGLEKEAGKLTLRGAVFAFNNGFMWQTVLKGLRAQPAPTTPSAPVPGTPVQS